MKKNWRTRTLFLFVIAVSSFTTLLMLQDFKEAAERSHLFSAQRSIRVRSVSILGNPPTEDLWRNSAVQKFFLFGVGQADKRKSTGNGDTNNDSDKLTFTSGGDGRKGNEIKQGNVVGSNSASNAINYFGLNGKDNGHERLGNLGENRDENQLNGNGSPQEMERDKLPLGFHIPGALMGAVPNIQQAVENKAPFFFQNIPAGVESKNVPVAVDNKNVPVPPNNPAVIDSKNVPVVANVPGPVENKDLPAPPNVPMGLPAESQNVPLQPNVPMGLPAESQNVPLQPNVPMGLPAESQNVPLQPNVPMGLPAESQNVPLQPNVPMGLPAESQNVPLQPNVPMGLPAESQNVPLQPNVPMGLPAESQNVPLQSNVPSASASKDVPVPPIIPVAGESKNVVVPPNVPVLVERKDPSVPAAAVDNQNVPVPPNVPEATESKVPAVVPNAPVPVPPNNPASVDSKSVLVPPVESKDAPVPPNVPAAVESKDVPVPPNVSTGEATKDILNSSLNNASTLSSTAVNAATEDVCQLLVERQSEHLSPLTTINRRIMVAKPPLTRQQISQVYRQGCGLTPDRAPDGQATWREGAMLYIPKNVTGEKRFGSVTVYNADFEPYVPYNHSVFFEGREHPAVPEKDHKIILTKLAGWDDVIGPQKLRACPDLPCMLTTDWKKYYRTASAVTFNGQLVRGRAPRRAHPDQVFILYFYEPLTRPWPAYNHIKNRNNGWMPIFNWTMSYHITSDILATYGMVRKRPQPLASKNYTDIVSRKTKKVAWFVSHCHTEGKRENYVAQLQKYIQVDIYGACGPLKCRKEVDTTCFSQVGRDYKFYFAFENSMCEDYTTEKLYRIFKSDAIIVSRGNSFNFRSLPDGTYIDASEFASPRALAERLLYLDSHDDEYMALLRGKDEFFASYQDYPHYVGKYKQLWVKYTWEYIPLCEVCQRVWNLDKYRKSYPNILDWLNERKCKAPKDL